MKKTLLLILTSALLLSLCCGCTADSPEPETPTATPTPLSAETADNDGEKEGNMQPLRPTPPEATEEPQPEITPPAQEPIDPASGTDVIYESETRPPDPTSNTDLEP